MDGTCKLCGETKDLQHSHVLPAFVFRWQRESSGNGYIRSTHEPDRRVQDGLKFYWLCFDCEQRFSRWEREFASTLFHPYLTRSGERFAYGPWLLKFCASVSWRVLTYGFEQNVFSSWSAEEVARAKEAEKVWREFLLGKRDHPGEFRQHVLPLDTVASATGDIASNMNRYFMRAIHLDIVSGPSIAFTYSKLGRWAIFGSISEPSGAWAGAKVNANEGVIGPRAYTLPAPLGDYWNEKARKMSAALASVSDKQHQKIESAFRSNLDRFVDSDAFAAMKADVDLFGADAFSQRAKSPSQDERSAGAGKPDD
jgi:hypothetical protein